MKPMPRAWGRGTQAAARSHSMAEAVASLRCLVELGNPRVLIFLCNSAPRICRVAAGCMQNQERRKESPPLVGR